MNTLAFKPIVRQPKAITGLDRMLEIKPDMTLRQFAEYFLSYHAFIDARPPKGGSFFSSTGLAFVQLYAAGRFSAYLAMMAPQAIAPARALSNTDRMEIYVAGDYYPERDNVRLLYDDQLTGDLVWSGCEVRRSEVWSVRAGDRGAVFLSLRREAGDAAGVIRFPTEKIAA